MLGGLLTALAWGLGLIGVAILVTSLIVPPRKPPESNDDQQQ